MRKLSVLTSLAAFALLAAPVVKADTLLAVDPPDVNLAPGTTAPDTFNLDDFFNSTSGAVSYTAVSGGSVNGSAASVDGLANAGTTGAVFSGSNGTDTLEVSSSVFVSTFNIGNGPNINNNNRWSGVAGGNKFANMISPGGSISSALPLTNLPAGGGGGPVSPGGVTGGGVTGGAALIATIASVGLNTDPVTGLRERTVNGPVAQGSNGQLTAELSADGSYSVTAGDNFSGNHIVTLGASSAGGTDAVHLLAAASTDVDLTNFGGGSVTVAAGGTSLLFDPNIAVPVNGDSATVVLYYTLSSTAGANLAVIGFDGAIAFQAVSFSNPGAANLEAGVNKGLATSFSVQSGSVIPGVQLNNAGSAPITLTINRLTVSSAGPLTDYALNPNATALSNSLSSIDGIIPDILGSGAAAPAVSTANNFASAGSAGAMALNGAGGTSNGTFSVAAGGGELVAEAYVQRSGNASADSALAVVITDGGATSISGFKPGGSIPTSGWEKVTVSGTTSSAFNGFLVIQAAGFNAIVDDVSLRVLADKPEHFDADLLG